MNKQRPLEVGEGLHANRSPGITAQPSNPLQQGAPAAGPQSLRISLYLPAGGLQMALLLCPGVVDAGSPGVQGVHQI